MNDSKPTDSSAAKPVLDPEIRKAINEALLYQPAIAQLTDSGQSAQRKRRALKLAREQHQSELPTISEDQPTEESPHHTESSQVQPQVQVQPEPEQSPPSQANIQPSTPSKRRQRLKNRCIAPTSPVDVCPTTSLEVTIDHSCTMDFDDIYVAAQDKLTREWEVVMHGIGGRITKLASMYNDEKPCYPFEINGGSFNYCVAVEFEDGQEDRTRWVMRFPVPGRVMDPEAKVKHEAATMTFLAEKTNIPVPKLIAWGTSEQNMFHGVGPFMIMEYVEGKPLHEVLKGRDLDDLFRVRSPAEMMQEIRDRAAAAKLDEDGPLLSPAISDETLKGLYRQIANIYLELHEHDFDHIGSLSIVDGPKRTWVVDSAPYTIDKNEQKRTGGVPGDQATSPFNTTSAWLHHLSEQKLTNLTAQRNSILDADDAREKLISRKLFRTLLPTTALTNPSTEHGPFKLRCDDLRPHNILVDRNLRITSIIDWEFSYTAPLAIAASAPRWLLLRDPEHWKRGGPGGTDLLPLFKAKLALFLTCMTEIEAERSAAKHFAPRIRDFAYRTASADPYTNIKPLPLTPPIPLSTMMARSLANKTFFLTQALLLPGSFDDIYWARLETLPPSRRVRAYLESASLRERQEVEDFAVAKMLDLQGYEAEMEERERERLLRERERRAGSEEEEEAWEEAVERIEVEGVVGGMDGA